MLYQAGDKKAAEDLGKIVADQLESIIKYFEVSDSRIASNPENTGDLYAALDAYFNLNISAIDPEMGNQTGELAKRTQAKINDLYKNVFPIIFSDLEKRANDAGESTRRGSKAGKYASRLFAMQDYINAIGVQYGYLQGQAAPTQPGGQKMNLDELMKQAPVEDSVNQ
jgi:hypothetical protein